MFRLATHAAAFLIISAPVAVSAAQGPKNAPAPSTIRTGTYDLELAIGGGTLQGTFGLTASGDSLIGALHVADHDVPVRNITRKGSTLTFDAGGEGMKISYTMTFTGDSLSGSFTFNGDPGFVTGKRRN